jgi:hypothetical protein
MFANTKFLHVTISRLLLAAPRLLAPSLAKAGAFTILAICVAGTWPSTALAQSTFGSIRGTVADASGAIVSDATVTLHSVEENTDRVATTDSSGAFLFADVKPGHFSLVAAHQGFSNTELTGISLDARQDLRAPVTLQVAEQTTTVEVTSSSDQINTESATISDSKDNTLMTQLPLNNRATTTSPLGALSLSPNVQQDSQGNIALGGASSSMVNFSVDGISTANVRQNGPLTDAYPSQEGIAAVKVTDFNNSAEFSQVGDVTFTTKSGSNNYHGSLFEYFQNDVLDSSPYGFNGKAPKNFNTFGGSFSGPVAIPHLYHGKDRTFFFADYEGNRRTLSVAQQFIVPTLAERGGNLSGLTDVNGNPVQNIPQASMNATAQALLGYYPLPNVSGNGYNYEKFQPTPAATDGADLRIDQTLNTKQSVYARFSRKNILEDVANPLLPNDSDSVHNRSLLVSYTYTITPRLLNEFRFGLTNATTSVSFPIEGAAALQQLDLQGVNISQHPLTHAFPTFNFSNGTSFQPIGRDKTGVTLSKTLQFSDNLTFSTGRHTLKAGIDIRRVRYFDIETFQPSDDFGSFTFQPGSGTNAFGNFLQGIPSTLFFAVSSPDVGGTAVQTSVFAQDEWQLSSKLTLSYGLRYQILPPFTEDGGNLANFDQRTNSIVVPDNLAGYLQQQNIVGSNVAFQQSFNACNLVQTQLPCTKYLTASQDHLSNGLRQTYKGNIQPRLAFAYRPFNDTKTVIRGGFGIFTTTNLGPLSFNNSGNPTSSLHTYTNGPGQPLIQFPNTAPPTVGVQYGGGSLDQGVDPNYRDPQANQYSLTIERELNASNSLRVSYVGMHTYRLNITEDLNQIPASTIPYNQGATAGVYVDSRAQYQNWNELYSTFNAGEANYNAVEIDASHRMAHGFSYNANYTLAKNLADNQGDNPSGFAGEVNYGIPIANRFDVKSDYGNVEGTRRNRFLFTGVGQLPFGEGRKYLNGGGIKDRILGGWDINTVTLIESGPWLTPSISPSSDQSNTNVQNRGAFARPDQASNNYIVNRSRAHYFNLAAFQPTPANAGRFGNAGVGVLEGPGTKTVALGVAKVFKITEGTHLRFESTFTNVFNHTNFAPPATQIDNSNFGQLIAATTAENAANRTGQFALRYDF